MPVGGDGDNLPVRQADGLARQVDFDELLALLHQPNRPGKHVIELGGAVRLHQIIKRVNRKRIERIFLRRGQEDDQAARAPLAHPLRNLDAVHALHADIQKNERVVPRRKAAQKSFPAVKTGDARAVRNANQQILPEQLARLRLVIDDGNAYVHGKHPSSASDDRLSIP